MWFKICGFSISRFCCKSHPSTKTTLELPCRCVEVRIKSQVTLPIYVYATYGAGQHDCAAPRFPNTKTLGRFRVAFFFPNLFPVCRGSPKCPWLKPAKSKGKVHERNPKEQTRGESQRLRALTSLEVDWGWWGRLLVGRGVALGVAEPPRRWPVHPPATRAKKPRRRACRRGRGWLTNG